jgi:hypothetical protein
LERLLTDENAARGSLGAARPAVLLPGALIQPSQMYTPGPAISFLTCFWLFPQDEHDRRFPESGTRPLYPGRACASPALFVPSYRVTTG